MTILASLACVVSSAGISRPAYADILETLQDKFKGIYGTDSYIDPDSQDGQLLATFAKAMDDANAVAVSIYSSFSPATAQGQALSNNVKINGIARAIATKSTAPLRVSGAVGTVIEGGVASDTSGNQWVLPDAVVIPPAGFVDVTATAELDGDIEAPTGTITNIETPTLGWHEVTNPSAASPGAPVESDAGLRFRQSVSVALPSRTVLSGLLGAIYACEGVTQARIYENDTNLADANGIPGHHIAVVVVGGVGTDIATAIMRKKTPGCGTHGTTTVAVNDPGGNPVDIKYFVPTQKTILVEIDVKALTGYVSPTGDTIKEKVAAYISALGIGKKVDHGRLYLPAQLSGGAGSETFEVNAIRLAASPGAPTAADVAIAFNEIAVCAVTNITLTVT